MNAKIKNGVVSTIGYLLSPLSWWNDLFFNIPLAYGFAYLLSLISKSLFYPMMVLGYWLTNIGGLILMHYGIKGLIAKNQIPYSKNDLLKDILFSILYTLVIVVAIKLGWLKLPGEYFK